MRATKKTIAVEFRVPLADAQAFAEKVYALADAELDGEFEVTATFRAPPGWKTYNPAPTIDVHAPGVAGVHG